MEDFGWILLGIFLLAKSGAGGSGQPLVNPTPNSIMMGGSVAIPTLGAALNSFSRPLTGSFGLAVGGPQSDPVYGNVGVRLPELGLSSSPGYFIGSMPGYNIGARGEIVTSYDQLTAGDPGPSPFSANDVFSFDQIGA